MHQAITLEKDTLKLSKRGGEGEMLCYEDCPQQNTWTDAFPQMLFSKLLLFLTRYQRALQLFSR